MGIQDIPMSDRKIAQLIEGNTETSQALNKFVGEHGSGGSGTKGDPGDSAYTIAKLNGFVGTKEEWLASLIGPKGSTGPQGPQGIQGPVGPQGQTGLQGPAGQIGPAGKDGAQGPAGAAGKDGLTGPQGPQGPRGEDGSANTTELYTLIDNLVGKGVVGIPVDGQPNPEWVPVELIPHTGGELSFSGVTTIAIPEASSGAISLSQYGTERMGQLNIGVVSKDFTLNTEILLKCEFIPTGIPEGSSIPATLTVMMVDANGTNISSLPNSATIISKGDGVPVKVYIQSTIQLYEGVEPLRLGLLASYSTEAGQSVFIQNIDVSELSSLNNLNKRLKALETP